MVSDESYTRQELLEIILFITIGLIMVIFLPTYVIGYALKGFEESFVPGKAFAFGDILPNYQLYIYLLIFGMGCILFPLTSLLILKKGGHPAINSSRKAVSRGWLILSNSFIFNMRNGALFTLFRKLGMSGKKNPFRWSILIGRVAIISFLIFDGIGILSLSNHSFQVVGIPQVVVQQVTPLTKLTFSAEPAAFAETTTILFTFMLMMGFVSLLCSYIKDENTALTIYYIAGVFICALNGLLFYFFHNIAYGSSAVAHFSTFFFGAVGSLLTLLTGTFLFFYEWHYLNNFYAKLVQLYPSNADVFFDAVLIWTLVLIAYVSIELLVYKYKKKHKSKIQEPTF